MRNFSVLLLLLSLAVAGYAQQTTLTVYFSYINIEKGYDHDNKTQVLIDGKMVGESAQAKESEGGKVSVQVPVGEHTISVVNWALYEGKWEEHTKANGYSIDATYEEAHTFQKNEKLYLVFDVDSRTHANWGKPVKIKASKGKDDKETRRSRQ